MAEVPPPPHRRNLLAVPPRPLPGVLCLRGERPRQCPKSHPAEERAPRHSITWSARPSSLDHLVATDEDRIYLESHKVSNECWIPLELSAVVPHLEDDILSFNVPMFADREPDQPHEHLGLGCWRES